MSPGASRDPPEIVIRYVALAPPMTPSYARIQLPLTEASVRFARWIGLSELEPPRRVRGLDAVSAACAGGKWRAPVALFVHEYSGWTVFDDLAGGLAHFSGTQWADFARNDELVFAGYNDSVPYGQLIVVRHGAVVREFLDDEQDPSNNVNRGQLEFEASSPIQNWIAAASFVDGDDLSDPGVETGLIWLFGRAMAEKGSWLKRGHKPFT